MNRKIEQKENLSLKNKLRRWFGKHFGSDENCNSQCSKCLFCPYVKNSNYTFEITKRD